VQLLKILISLMEPANINDGAGRSHTTFLILGLSDTEPVEVPSTARG
jgi:hypothetical protein